MEARQFTELLKHPLLVAQLPIEEVRELANRYPYSASLQMLLLKRYQLADHPNYDEQLAKAAIYAPDRRALYSLMQLEETEAETSTKITETTAWHSEPETEVTDTAIIEETIPEPYEASNLAADMGSAGEVAPEPETLPYTPGPALEAVAETTVEAPEAIEETQQTEIPSEAEVDPMFGFLPPLIPHVHLDVRDELLETETDAIEGNEEDEGLMVQLQETITDSPADAEEEESVGLEPATILKDIDIEIGDMPMEPVQAEIAETPEEDIEQPIVYGLKPETTQEAILAEHSESTDTNDNQEDAPPAKTEVKTTGKDSFTGWLHRLKQEHHTGTEPITRNPQLETPPPAVDEQATLDELFGAGTYEATLIKASADLPDVTSLKPHKPTKEELMEPDEEANRRMDEQAKKSLSMGEELVTETLAKIYEIQKKYPKAIEAYEVLKLRYPEKAAQYDRKIQLLREN